MQQNPVVQPLLTDLYQITMAYAYWKSGKAKNYAVFDLFFRKNPFQGEFTIFAGLEEVLRFLARFSFSQSDLDYIKQVLPQNIEDDFFEYLSKLDAKDVLVYAMKEGNVAFPKIPLLRVEGPLIMVQLLETALLNLVNYASLIATNAARIRTVSESLKLYEFGLRRAQGPDGALSASKYAYIGGFDGTSNVLAGKLFNIPVKGTHAHSFITAFSELNEIPSRHMVSIINGESIDFVDLATSWRQKVSALFKIMMSEVNNGEFAAFISYAIAFPSNYLALVDTYDVLKSGLINFSAVALSLFDLGFKPIGIRIDSGDLAYLSIIARSHFKKIQDTFNYPDFGNLMIMASNDINEETILSLNEQGHEIDSFGIGTHLVTCQKQPALGGVYKMVELNGQPRIKLSHDVNKVTIPGKKNAYRLYSEDQSPLIDLLQLTTEPPPVEGQKVLCRHPFQESKRAFVIPSRVENLLELYWSEGKICQQLPKLEVVREKVIQSMGLLRPDIKRALNPTPYKVAVSDNLYQYMHNLWLENAPIGELY